MNRLIGIRKTFVTLLVFGCSIWLLMAKIITGAEWVQLNQIVIPAYIAGNLAEHWMNRPSRKPWVKR